MAAQWPISLQQRLNASDFSFNLGSTNIKSQMSTGPFKVRKRFTKALDKISGSILMDRTEWPTFRTFHDITLNNGVLPFEYTDPLTGIVKEYRFMEEPSVRAMGGVTLVVQMVWVLA